MNLLCAQCTTGSDEVKGVRKISAVDYYGDTITAIDGYELQDFDDLIAYLVRETEVGQRITLTIIRDEEVLEVSVTLGERP